MEQKRDYKEKYEKGKLHVRYLFIIAGILAVIGISIALGGNSEALGQISMASTVSSIILSAIAIFLSISGENKLNYTQNTLLETSDRLSSITDNIEHANGLLGDTIYEKLSKLDEISDRLERIGQSVNNVEKEVFSKSLHIENDRKVTVQKENLWQVYYDMIEDTDAIDGEILKLTIEYLVVSVVENSDFNPENLEKYLISALNVSSATYAIGLSIGMLKVFIMIGIAENKTIKYFQEKMALSQEEINEIKKFL